MLPMMLVIMLMLLLIPHVKHRRKAWTASNTLPR